MLPEQLTGMRLPTETGQSILITSAPPSNTSTQTGATKVQHIVVRDTNQIKQEYFVDNSTSEITTIQTNNANMMSNNNVSTLPLPQK